MAAHLFLWFIRFSHVLFVHVPSLSVQSHYAVTLIKGLTLLTS